MQIIKMRMEIFIHGKNFCWSI